jgi:hypothetical protein
VEKIVKVICGKDEYGYRELMGLEMGESVGNFED